VQHEKCNGKIAEKVRQKNRGRKSATEKVRQKNCDNKFATAELQQQNHNNKIATTKCYKKKQFMVFICVVLNL
jgi:hypothetical protein